MKNHRDDVLISETVVGNLNALYRGQAVQYHLPHGLLHAGITVKTQIYSKTYNSGFGHAYGLAKAVGSHKRCLVIRIRNIAGNPLLAL